MTKSRSSALEDRSHWWWKLPLELRQRWWTETDFNKRPPSPALAAEAWRVINQWLVGFAEEEASFSRYADNALIDGVLPAGTVREMARLLAGDGERP